MDLDYANYMVTGGRKGKENSVVSSPSSEAYRKLLDETFNMNRPRILTFKEKPPTPVEAIPRRLLSPPPRNAKSAKPRRQIPQV